MADLTTILERLESLEREVETLKAGGAADNPAQMSAIERVAYFESLPPNAVVGKDYVAYRFGCSVRAVLNGERGTKDIRRVSKSPLKFIRREVDAAFEKQKKIPLKTRAANIRKSVKPRRYSVVGK